MSVFENWFLCIYTHISNSFVRFEKGYIYMEIILSVFSHDFVGLEKSWQTKLWATVIKNHKVFFYIVSQSSNQWERGKCFNLKFHN